MTPLHAERLDDPQLMALRYAVSEAAPDGREQPHLLLLPAELSAWSHT